LLEIIVSIVLYKNRLVHIDVFSGQSFQIARIASILLKLRKKTIVYTLHGGRLPFFFQENTVLVSKTLKRADFLQTPSLYLQSYFTKHGFEIHYLPNSINLKQFKYKRLVDNERFSLLWVRAFDKIYNPDIPVRVLYELKKEFPKIKLTMVGPDKGMIAEVKNLARDLDVFDDICFTGPVKNTELSRYYHSHSVYLNTTSFESFGLSVLEAAACGIPIVSNNVGEIPFLWEHGKSAMLVEQLDVTQYCMNISNLFNDAGLTKRLSLNARKKAEQFGQDKVIPQWVDLFKRFS